jgi:hypothetical protein
MDTRWEPARLGAQSSLDVHCLSLSAASCLFAGKDSKSKPAAAKAARAVKKGSWKKSRKPRYSVTFHRPKTLVHARNPKFPRQRCDGGCLRPQEWSGKQMAAACSSNRC